MRTPLDSFADCRKQTWKSKEITIRLSCVVLTWKNYRSSLVDRDLYLIFTERNGVEVGAAPRRRRSLRPRSPRRQRRRSSSRSRRLRLPRLQWKSAAASSSGALSTTTPPATSSRAESRVTTGTRRHGKRDHFAAKESWGVLTHRCNEMDTPQTRRHGRLIILIISRGSELILVCPCICLRASVPG